ncbi:MAG: metal ABC transporter ATP-binding protein [Christensenellales bacterium]|jgi:manganese/zinc/iron transport system ATP- binding protein
MEHCPKNDAVVVEHLTVAYEQQPVLWDVSLTIPKGTLFAIVGPNGAGKTSLIKTILGQIRPVFGSVTFGSPAAIGRAEKPPVGYVPQIGSADWDFPATVLDIVTMGTYGSLGWFKRPGKAELARAAQAIDKMGMQGYEKRQINQLSGGQQQRVFLARALAQQAEIYFMDEPLKGVDMQTEQVILQQLKELRHQGKTVVVIHHDIQTVADNFDWVALINLSLIACGPIHEVFHEENLVKTYQGVTIGQKGAL